MSIKEQALNLRKSGLSLDEIAEALDQTRRTVSYWCAPDDKQKARQLRDEGKALREICEILGRPIGTIAPWCNKVESPKKYNHKKGYKVHSPETKQKALNAIREGASLYEAAADSKIPEATLRRWAEKAKIPFREKFVRGQLSFLDAEEEE